jgi:hypothetical protein
MAIIPAKRFGLCLATFIVLACSQALTAQNAASTDLPPGTWRFIVSGDSRNCGDVVMPAIAAHSMRFAPSFYWHLGDLRALYKIDEDMADAATQAGSALTCEVYRKLAWPDFITHQIAPWGTTPFFAGIGNHERIPPKTTQQFAAQFADWLDTPVLRQQRLQDNPQDILPKTYYHWIQSNVDFIYLDNALDAFSPEQLAWLDRVLDRATGNPNVRSLVVGMHEALPHSMASDHAMGDLPEKKEGMASGERAYKAFLAFHHKTGKPVYLLASHSHFFMEGIFNNLPKDQRLPGWIIGTAGAVRYPLPTKHFDSARTVVYGYLLATVHPDGTVDFKFQQVHQEDVPAIVQRRYSDGLVPWCFAHNSANGDNNVRPTASCIDPPAH